MATKAELTREKLVETALRLFRERGYEKTTMRAIATEAEVSLGNAYYYFEGKDAFVQELYVRIQAEHRALALPRLRPGAPLAENLRVVLHTGIDVMAPFHEFGSTMLAVALRPTETVSPFSPDSAPAREAATALMREVLEQSKGSPGGPLREHLPNLLWLAYLGVTLHWVSDAGTAAQRTRRLIDGLAPLIARAIALTRVPGGRALAADVIALLGPGPQSLSPQTLSPQNLSPQNLGPQSPHHATERN